MAMVISPDSEYGKEMAKWNKPYVYVAYPKMMYKARRRPDGVVSVSEPSNSAEAEAFNASCQRVVGDEDEKRRAAGDGWCDTPTLALERFHGRDKFLSNAAAHRAYEDRNMGELAQAEIAVADAETSEHVAEIVEKRKRGRPRKIVA